MPSSHTSLVMGLTTSIGVMYGTNSVIFAVALVFSLIVRFLPHFPSGRALVLISVFLVSMRHF